MKNKTDISNQEQKNCIKRLSDHENDNRKELLDFSTAKIARKNQENSHSFTTQMLRKSSCSNNSIFSCSNNNNTSLRYNNGINRSATTNDVHLLIHEEIKDEERKDDSAITANTPFLPKSESTNPKKVSLPEIVDDAEKKPINFNTTATVLVATTKLKSCLKNPLRKKKKNADLETDGSKKLKKKQSKKHICWEIENDMNLIQNEEDGRGMQSKILNMAIVASGPAFLHGGGLNPESRRSSNPETPLITRQQSIDSNFDAQGRKSSLLMNSLNAVSRTSSVSTVTNTRRRSSVMVTSLVKSLDKLGKYRPTFKSSSNANKPSQLHNIMASATIYTTTTKVLTTTTISDATTSFAIDTTAMSHSQPTQASSASNPSFACQPNQSNTKLFGDGGAGIIENVNDIVTEVYDSPSLSLKSCPASVPRRRKRSIHTHNIDEKRRPSVHDEVAKARGKGILSPRFVPRSKHNGISQSRDLHDRIRKKRSPKRGARSRRNSIRNASQNNLKSICT